MTRKRSGDVRSIVVVSDTHCGCQLGLCPPSVPLDGGGTYEASRLQRIVWGWWDEFWRDFVPKATKGEPFAVVMNGDCLDGVHHGATTQITHNMNDQRMIAQSVLEPIVEACGGRYWHIRGTEAHVGQAAEHEEAVARSLGAIPDEDGNHARWNLRATLGEHRIHFAHHISPSQSPFAKSGALQREMVGTYVQTGKWGDAPYSMLVRSHRHEHSETVERGAHGKITVTVTPAWQLFTPFVHKTAARVGQPEIGGIVIRLVDDELFTRAFVKRISPPREERIA